MPGVNKVILVGRLGQDPESRDVGDSTVCNFSIATSEKWKDKSGNKQENTSWHRIVAWGKLAEICQQYLKKGDNVYVEGQLQYTEKDGKYYTDIKIFNMNMLGGNAAPAGGKVDPEDEDPDKIPF